MRNINKKDHVLFVMRLIIVVSNVINVQQTIAFVLTTPKENEERG
jgi:hypothetical protein